MGQFNYAKKKTTPSVSSPEWLSVSSAIGRMANSWAGRYDIAAFAGPNAAEGHPAFFNPLTAEVEVNVEKCFGDDVTPEMVGDISDRDVQYEFPRATGAIFHEAMHARYSLWDLAAAQKDLTRAEFRVLVSLEEGRIESHGLKRYPSNAAFLRSTVLDLVIADAANVQSDSDTVMAGELAALALARVDAGSCDESDVCELHDVIESKLGADRLEKLRNIWVEAQHYDQHDYAEGLYPLAKEWVRIIDEAAEENGDQKSDEAGSGAGAGAMTPSEFAEAIQKALEEGADSAMIGAFNDLADVQMSEEWAEQVNAKQSAAKTAQEARAEASKVFGTGTSEIPTTTSRSTLAEERAPRGDERSAAVQLAQLLEKAKYRDRDETEVHSVIPPGRLRTRAAVQGVALKSKGIMTKSEPWRQTKRKHVDDPTLNIGVMVDISGSMGAAMQPMASLAWVLSESVRRVQGRSAMVYFGNDVFPTLKPGQHLDRVRVFTAPDMTEKFDRAFKALDGGLNLLNGSGARMLVVVSDGEYPEPEKNAVRKWIAACEQSGVAVVWLSFPGGYGDPAAVNLLRGTKAALEILNLDLKGSAKVIGTAAVKALSAAS
jgi:hypothetical protein